MIGSLYNKKLTGNDKYIQNRRNEENKLNVMKDYLKLDQKSRHLAKFNNNYNQINFKKNINQEMINYKIEKEKNLEKRRNKLRELYLFEEEFYKEELRKLKPDNNKIKNIMREKVEILKEKNNLENQKIIEAKLDQKFKENADELRLVDVKIKEHKTKLQLEIQMIEKQKQLERKYQEEMLYAKLWEKDIECKESKEKEILKRNLEKIKERNEVLKKQINEIKEEKKIENLKTLKEKQNLKEKWKKEDELAKFKEEEKKRHNIRINEEVKLHNLEQNEIKEKIEREEKEKDKKMVEDQIEREKLLEKIERDQKEKYKEETKQYLLNFKNRSNELKLNQNLLDKLLNEEMEKQWNKQLDKWRKEEEKRVNLMYDVYNNRAGALKYQKELKNEEKIIKLNEKNELEKDLAKFEIEEVRKETEERMRLKQYQVDILNQINNKLELERKKIFENLEEERLNKLKNLEYEQKIKQEQLKGQQLLDEVKKLRII